jgi:uncharacterized ferritin-like protein (DUF455 family)
MSKLSNYYYVFAMSHGFLRTLYYTKNAKKEERDLVTYKHVERDMLYTEKATYAVLNSVMNIAFCPFNVIDDIATFECYIRGMKRYTRPCIFPFEIKYE